jgi:hypothetical protein
MTFAERFPQSTHLIDGVEVHTTGPIVNGKTRAVMWMSDWARAWELVDAGFLRAEHGGPDTYGHITLYVCEASACPRCGQMSDRASRCGVCKALEREPQGEAVRLFEPAPAQLEGQRGLW